MRTLFDTINTASAPGRFFGVLAFVLFSLMATAPVQAQLNADLGVQAGRTATTLSGTTSWADTGWRSGWTVAGTARIPLSRQLRVHTRVAYTQKGMQGTAPPTLGATDITMKMNYVEIPVLVEATWARDAFVTSHLFAGPAIGFNMNATYASEETLTSVPALRSEVNRTEASVVVGLGGSVEVNYHTVVLQMQYQAGLTPVLDTDNGTLRTHAVGLMLEAIF